VPHPLYTIGHSNHAFERFVALLHEHGVELVADVRSVPASARHPQFRRKALEPALAARDIRYLFLGQELGARRTEREAYENGVATYERIARLPAFRAGLERVKEISASSRIALMCAEKAPLDCHRALLVCRHLRDAIAGGIHHILADGSLEAHAEVERRLVAHLTASEAQADLFAGETEAPLERAYRTRSLAIAYRQKPALGGKPDTA
jgi:uncharacterized protein (DUF488 family)